MLPLRRSAQYAALTMLALLTVGLSVAALLQGRPAVSTSKAVPAPVTTASPPPSSSPSTTPLTTASASQSPSAMPSVNLASVVVVGDVSSLSGGQDGWVERTARTLKWQITNLSATGMGFTKVASHCPSRCTAFKGVIPAIVDAKPDIVVVFGGMADGDYPIGPESREFFTTLRKALPKAKIVALSPVMTNQGQLGWVRLHRNNIEAATAAVNGRFVDVGQPPFRSGALTAKGQEQVSKRVVSALR